MLRCLINIENPKYSVSGAQLYDELSVGFSLSAYWRQTEVGC